MPIFEFTCAECGENFEILVLSGEAIECPKCGNKNVIKQLSKFAVSCPCEDSCPTDAKHKHKCGGGCCH
ncbi:MAG: zinc ribbon domain-containing protein [Endomicrobium sp.]|jgi:putative FmdB family regulatory protein|nr:zinc ribbon domain-containing protein [Endomicrobium sp.]